MLNTFHRVSAQPSQAAASIAVKVGFAALCLSKAAHKRKVGPSYFADIILPSIKHRTIRFYFDPRGEPVGYVVWATLENSAPTVQDGMLKLHLSEWNEGSSFWIVDCVLPQSHLRLVWRDFSTTVLSAVKCFHYISPSTGVQTISLRYTKGCDHPMPTRLHKKKYSNRT